MRKFVFARKLSLMTPAGRWVASTRCKPDERPRWATLTTPSTNSGTSWTNAANSSTTMTRLGGASLLPIAPSGGQILGLVRREQLFAEPQLGSQ